MADGELTPRAETWEILRTTQNTAAIELLGKALPPASRRVQQDGLKVLFARREPAAYRGIISIWEDCKVAQSALAAEHRAQLDTCTRVILETGSLVEKRLAIEAIASLKLTSSLKYLIPIVLDGHHALQVQATKCMLELCVHWGAQTRSEQNSGAKRIAMLETLYGYLVEFPTHGNTVVLDCWLALVHWDDSLQRGIVAEPGGNIYPLLLERLRSNHEHYVLELLAGYVARTTTPKSLLELICNCDNPRLADEFAGMVDKPIWATVGRRLRDLPTLKCLKMVGLESSKNYAYERRIWTVISHSSDDIRHVLGGALRMAKFGSADGRKTAAEVVRNCRRPTLDAMVSELQAVKSGLAAAESLGTLLMEIAHWLSSPSTALQQAASDLFNEFTAQNLINQLPKWPNSMCKAMASIVKLYEKNLTDFLAKELQSPAPKRRLAAVQATHLLDLHDAVSQYLLPMLQDPRMEVRIQVIDLLSELGSNHLNELLPQWLNDPSSDIQDAANRALRRRDRRAKAQETGVA
jgi:HEAT repeats